MQLADEAMEIALASGDDITIARVEMQLLSGLQGPIWMGRYMEMAADAAVRVERIGDPVLSATVMGYQQYVAAWSGDFDELDRLVEIRTALIDQVREPFMRWTQAMNESLRVHIAGDADLAEELADDALLVGTAGDQPEAALMHAVQAVAVSWLRGSMGELVPILTEVAEATPGVPALTGYLALACVEGDDLDRAGQLLDRFGAAGYLLPQDNTWLDGMVEYAEAAIESRAATHARHISAQLAPFADKVAYNGVTCEGPVSYFLGGLQSVLGHYDEAESYFARSAALCERIGARFFGARTDLLWGRMLAERDGPDDRERGRRLLEKARSVAEAGGYEVVRRHAEAAISSLV